LQRDWVTIDEPSAMQEGLTGDLGKGIGALVAYTLTCKDYYRFHMKFKKMTQKKRNEN
jgi:hypothetical protein